MPKKRGNSEGTIVKYKDGLQVASIITGREKNIRVAFTMVVDTGFLASGNSRKRLWVYALCL